MKLAVHALIKGKPTKDDKGVFWCDDKKVNLGYGWTNIECSWSEAFALITEDGYATSAELLDDHRCDANFASRQIIMVDIDSGMTIEQLAFDEFYDAYGAGFYTTVSHTEQAHRFRLVFITEQPITDSDTMKKIIRGLMLVYNHADANCKDSTRIYYGTPNCPIIHNNNKILLSEVTDRLVAWVDEIDREAEEKLKTKPIIEYNREVDYEFVDALLGKISHRVGSLQGDYGVWRTIAWASCHAIGVHNAQNLMMKYWAVKTKKELQTLKGWKVNHKSPTVGTLVKLSGITSTERQLLELQMKMRKIK